MTVQSARSSTPDGGSLFNGMRFFVLQKVPLRAVFIEKIKNHGGSVVKLEGQATHIIADHIRKDAPDGSVSWKYIDQALKEGQLPDVENYIIHTDGGPLRPVGSTIIAHKKTKTEYTKADDAELLKYVEHTIATDKTAYVKGNKIYQEFAATHPKHTWQSYRDHFLRHLARPELLSGGNKSTARKHGVSSHPTEPPVASEEQEMQDIKQEEIKQEVLSSVADVSKIVHADVESSKDARTSRSSGVPAPMRKQFTPEEDVDLFDYVMSKPEGQRSGNVIYEAYAKENPEHTAQSWRDRFVKRLKKNSPGHTRQQSDRLPSPPTNGRTRVDYTAEDDWALYEYVQSMAETKVGGNRIYKDFALLNPRHSWSSWRDRYMKILARMPPDGPGSVVSPPPDPLPRQPVDQDPPSSGADRISLNAEKAQLVRPPQETPETVQAQVSVPLATRSNARAATYLDQSSALVLGRSSPSPKQTPTAVMIDPALQDKPTAMRSPFQPLLDDGRQRLLEAILARRPKDSKRVPFSKLELTHLIASLADPASLAVNSQDITPWQEWTRAVESRTAEDWKNLYKQHILPIAKAQGDDHFVSVSQAWLREGVASERESLDKSQFKRSSDYESPPSSKRQRLSATATDDESLLDAEEHIRASQERTTWLFEQAAQRKQLVEEGSAHSTAKKRSGPGQRLTIANLAAQARSLHQQEANQHIHEHHTTPSTAKRSGSALPIAPADDPAPVSSMLPSHIPETCNPSFSIPVPPSISRPGSRITTTPRLEHDHLESVSQLDLDTRSPLITTALSAIGRAQQLPDSPDGLRNLPSEIENIPGHASSYSQRSKWPSSPPVLGLTGGMPNTFYEYAALGAALQQRQENRNEEVQPPDFISKTTLGSTAFPFDTQAVMEAETQTLDLDLPEPSVPQTRKGLKTAKPSIHQHRHGNPVRQTTEVNAAATLASQGSNPDSQHAVNEYISRFTREGISRREIGEVLEACSGRPEMATALMIHKIHHIEYQPNAPWRWTREEDKALQDGNAKVLRALEEKHGRHEFEVRLRFLHDMMSSDSQ